MSQAGFLDQACDAARARVANARTRHPVEALQERAAGRQPPGFAAALAAPGVSVIAEVKRASPSKGHIADIPHASDLAARYAAGGASAVSVLTEPEWFKGTLRDLEEVADLVEIPVLRKDFVVEEYQLWEAAAAGAAAALLIVAALDSPTLEQLFRTCARAGLDALVEVHDEGEAATAASAWETAARPGRLVLGVNARDLTTLQVDPGRFAAVRGALPDEALTVAESGVQAAADVERLAALGADAVLVGEAVARADDPEQAVRELVAAGRPRPATTQGGRDR